MSDIVMRALHIFPLTSSGRLPESLPAPGEGAENLDLILFCSSGELGVLQQKDIADWTSRKIDRQHGPECVFVSLACASWYAALLEFERSPCRHAELWVIEAPTSFIQERLDCAGLGSGGEGLSVQPGIARMILQKCQAKPGEQVLDVCALLAKPAGMRGTEQLVKRYGQWLADGLSGYSDADWVSFTIATDWSTQLLAGLSRWFPQVMDRLSMLPSMETDIMHLMAMKPLYELRRELAKARQRPLFVTTLAAGGRIGCVRVRTAAPPVLLSPRPKAFKPVMITGRQVEVGVPPDYCDPQYRYVDNQYFLTELSAYPQCSRTWNGYE